MPWASARAEVSCRNSARRTDETPERRPEVKLPLRVCWAGTNTTTHSSGALESGNAWRKYARRAALGGLVLDLVPLEECHRRQMEEFQDRLDAETVYRRHGSCFSAGIRKSTAWLERQWNKEGCDVFSLGTFLQGFLIRIGSLHKMPGGKSAEVALVVAPEFQGLGGGGAKGVGGLLLEDLIRYARQQQLESVTAHFAVCNSCCERLLRKHGFDISTWSYLKQEGSAILQLRRPHELPKAEVAVSPTNALSRSWPSVEEPCRNSLLFAMQPAPRRTRGRTAQMP